MPPSDLEIQRLAHQLIQRHGDKAIATARKNVEEMLNASAHKRAPIYGYALSSRSVSLGNHRQTRDTNPVRDSQRRAY